MQRDLTEIKELAEQMRRKNEDGTDGETGGRLQTGLRQVIDTPME